MMSHGSTMFSWATVAMLSACSSGDESARLPALQLTTELVTVLGAGADSHVRGALPSASRTSSNGRKQPELVHPTYVRFSSPDLVWVLDPPRLLAFSSDGTPLKTHERVGSGPGEVRMPIAFDASENGDAWIADVGNGKLVGLDTADGARTVIVETVPQGVVQVGDEFWVAGDLRRSLFVRYSPTGERVGSAGTPINTARYAYRFNQGVAVRGARECAVVWAYTFRSLIECLDFEGHTVWRVDGPSSVQVPDNPAWTRMSSSDTFAYVDIASSNGRIYCLFIGGPATADGIQGRELHIFSEVDGRFLGVQKLPRAANYFARYGSLLAIVARNDAPQVFLYRIISED